MSKELDYIADLERENRLLGERCNQLLKDKGNLTDELQELKEKLTEKVTLESLDVVSAKMNDLEKENSELKRNKKTVVHLADCLEEKMKERNEELETRCNELFLQNNEFAEHLTKAKELIEDMYDKIPASHSDYYKDVMERARQFIKEIEK